MRLAFAGSMALGARVGRTSVPRSRCDDASAPVPIHRLFYPPAIDFRAIHSSGVTGRWSRQIGRPASPWCRRGARDSAYAQPSTGGGGTGITSAWFAWIESSACNPLASASSLGRHVKTLRDAGQRVILGGDVEAPCVCDVLPAQSPAAAETAEPSPAADEDRMKNRWAYSSAAGWDSVPESLPSSFRPGLPPGED